MCNTVTRMPYPFRYPTPSERRARVKRHRSNALALLVTALVMAIIQMAGIGTSWAWFLGTVVGGMAGIGVGIMLAHAKED